MSKKLKFIIVSEPYDERRGASIVLHGLSKKLSELGDEVVITCEPKYKGVKNFYDIKDEILNINDYIVICSESIDIKNYLEPIKYCNNIVRWILYKFGFFSMAYSEQSRFQGLFQSSDIIYQYGTYFTKGSLYENSKELVYFEPKFEKFYNKKIERLNENCILIKKGKHKNNKIKGLIIDELLSDESIKNIDEHLSEIFNKYEIFISYDTSSYHSVQAALCGCISVVIPDDGVSKEQWLKNQKLMKYGIAYGLEDLEWAIKTQDKVKNHLLSYQKECDEMIENFREDCINNFTTHNLFSVSIQTKWQSLKIIKLIEQLQVSKWVGEILIIDNNKTERPNIKDFQKIKFISETFLYPNESYNLSVKKSTYELICFCDDSLEFDCEEIFDWVYRNKGGLGSFGINPVSYFYETNYTSCYEINSQQEFRRQIEEGFDKLLFLRKSSYISIPEEIKINHGINWICNTNRPTYSILTMKRILTYKKDRQNLAKHKEDFIHITRNDDFLWTKINQNL